MRIGIFADSHDHLDNVRLAVAEFNRAECDLVVFAGDFCASITIPPLRKLRCKIIGCFGDNDGNKIGILGGMRIVGQIGEPPLGFRTPDGVRILVTHMFSSVRDWVEGADVIIYGHTHKPKIVHDEAGRLYVNPGETSGWTYRQPSIAILETSPLSARIIPLLPQAAVEVEGGVASPTT